MSLGLVSCHSSRNAVEYDSIYAERAGGGKSSGGSHCSDRPAVPQVPGGDAGAVIKAARSWLGVPYAYGGNSRNGTDCSGLACMAYETGAGIKLPRSSREQAEYCRRIRRDELRPGDLVFFTSSSGGSRINHVAIYIGDNMIIHATTSQGVTVSSLDERYWSRHFYCCGRVL